MTLDEAIKHYYDLSKNMNKCAEISVSEDAKQRLIRTANQHKQLAEWLKELKDLRILIGGEDNYLTEPTEQADVQSVKRGSG